MSEEPTQALPSEKSFEERVFGQFDAMSKRFDSIDARLQKLETGAEQKAFDTKPIWERALAEILETRQDMGVLRSEVTELRSETKEGFRDISRKLVVMFDDIVQLRADQLYAGNRLDKLESKPM